MLWIIALAFIAGHLSAGLILLLVFSLMAASARRDKAAALFTPPRFGP